IDVDLHDYRTCSATAKVRVKLPDLWPGRKVFMIAWPCGCRAELDTCSGEKAISPERKSIGDTSASGGLCGRLFCRLRWPILRHERIRLCHCIPEAIGEQTDLRDDRVRRVD